MTDWGALFDQELKNSHHVDAADRSVHLTLDFAALNEALNFDEMCINSLVLRK